MVQPPQLMRVFLVRYAGHQMVTNAYSRDLNRALSGVRLFQAMREISRSGASSQRVATVLRNSWCDAEVRMGNEFNRYRTQAMLELSRARSNDMMEHTPCLSRPE